MTETGFYITGGTMPCNAPSYVERQADHDLYDALTRGEFCYVLTARQLGKSSLMVRTAARLRAEGADTAILDLTVIGQNLTPEQWYSSLLATLGEQLDREKELWEYWQAHSRVSPVQRWIGALRAVVSGQWSVVSSEPEPLTSLATAHCPLITDPRLVIFIDEIDAVLNLPFSSDEFFAAIRACFNLRSREPELHRLTFCLLGVATPSDLIQDARTTPFNIGRRIELADFTAVEAAPLAEGLVEGEGPPFAERELLQRIMHWTGGHPYLTQRLCQAVAQQNAGNPKSKRRVPTKWAGTREAGGGTRNPKSEVDRQCEALFLSASARERDDNLLFVRERLLRSEPDVAGVLDLYQRVRSGQQVLLEETNQLACILLLSGIALVEQARRRPRAPWLPFGKPLPALRVRNRIYEQVFDRAWVTQHMPEAELRRQRRAYRAGLARAASAAGIVLLVVTGLAIAALEQAHRAERAEGRAKDDLWASYLAQAHAGRWSGQPGRRFDGLVALARAAGIRPSLDLRNEAIACMSLIDVRRQWQWRFEPDIFGLDFSPDLKRVALGDKQGNVWVYRVADRRLLNRFSGLRGADRPLLSHFSEPIGLVGPVRFSPDGRFLAGGYRRPETADLVVWDLNRKREILRLPDGLNQDAVEFSPDSRRIAVGRGDRTIRLYDLSSGTETGWLPPGLPPAYLQFDPGGRRLAVSSLDVRSVQIRDVATGAVTATLVSPTEIFSVAWHPYRNLVAGAGADWHVYIWDVDKPQQPLVRLEGHHGEVTRVGFTQGGTLLVSSGWDHTVRLWNLATQSQLLSLPGSTFSPGRGEQHLGMLLGGNTAQIWELATARECRTFRHYGAGKGPLSGAISRDGRLLASSGEHGVAVWDLTTGRQLASLLGKHNLSAFFHPTAPYLITSGADGLYRWPIQYSAGGAVAIGPSHPITHAKGFERSVMSRDGLTLAVTENHANSSVHVLHFGQPAWRSQIKAQRATRLFLDVSPDGRWIVTGAWHGTGVNVYEARTRRLVKALPVHDDANVRFSPDGRWLATATGAVSQVWRVGSWQPVRVFRRDDPDVTPGSMVFTPDGAVAALQQSDRVVKLMEVSTGRELARLEAADVPVCLPLSFSPDGSLLATRGGPELLQLWDLRAIRQRLKAMGLDWSP